MKIVEKEQYKLLKDETGNVQNFSAEVEADHQKFEEDNLVIDLLQYGALELEELLSFLKLSNQHRASKKSFVIVNDAINIDRVPEELQVVPTLVEAEDIIQMEEIERDLGF
jgi:hypothetical protein